MGKPNLTLCPEEEQELNTCGQHILVMTIGQKRVNGTYMWESTWLREKENSTFMVNTVS